MRSHSIIGGAIRGQTRYSELYDPTANVFVNKKQTGRYRWRAKNNTEHRYTEYKPTTNVITSRIRPIAFDIVKDVGVSGSGATVPLRHNPHVGGWCAEEDHSCDRPEVLMSDPTV